MLDSLEITLFLILAATTSNFYGWGHLVATGKNPQLYPRSISTTTIN